MKLSDQEKSGSSPTPDDIYHHRNLTGARFLFQPHLREGETRMELTLS